MESHRTRSERLDEFNSEVRAETMILGLSITITAMSRPAKTMVCLVWHHGTTATDLLATGTCTYMSELASGPQIDILSYMEPTAPLSVCAQDKIDLDRVGTSLVCIVLCGAVRGEAN